MTTYLGILDLILEHICGSGRLLGDIVIFSDISEVEFLVLLSLSLSETENWVRLLV